MKLVNYRFNEKTSIGVLSPNGKEIWPLSAFGVLCETLEQLIIESDRAALDALKAAYEKGCDCGVPFEKATLLAPIPHPRMEFLMLESNFYKDADEQRAAVQNGTAPTHPVVYFKKTLEASPNGATVPSYPGYAGELDYEPGVLLITNADIRSIPESDAGKYIFGYTILSSVISREVTVRHRRPMVSSSLDGFAPMGPWIVTADELGENPVFQIETKVNGKTVQKCSTELMKFTENAAVSKLCIYSQLDAASLIWLGTPFGTGRDQKPPCFLKPGDKVQCEVSSLGTLQYTVK